jgi:hypothetical protein
MNSLPLQRQRPARIAFGRFGVASAVAVTALLFGGCATQAAKPHVDLFVARAPLPTLVPRGQAMAAAERMAATREGDFALHGIGRSMEPVYVAGTAVVVHPTAFHMLRQGQAVVYTNRRGAHVAHMLVEQRAEGWVATGLNNAEPDAALVTAHNLVGVIRHAFVAEDTVFRPDIAAQLALQSTLRQNTPLALFH